MGKDNIPFHSVLFPASLIGTGDKYTLVDTLSVNEYLNYENDKFSKSRGVGIFGDNIQESGIPADIWRYYIMMNSPERTDTNFSWKDFQDKLNNEIVGNFANLS
jgi:methionyl-tRNA synthetase